MNAQIDKTTATLAVLYGLSLAAAEKRAEAHGTFDTATARELAVIGRILERRLGETRQSIAAAQVS